MNDRINAICDEAERNARMCYRAGEKIEDISEAVFSHIFNFAGHNPGAKSWAMNAASGIVEKIKKSGRQEG